MISFVKSIKSGAWFNRVVKYFVISDLLLWTGWGVIDPIFSVFIVSKIVGATLLSVGLMATIYWLTRAVFQIPISLYLDKNDGEKDDFYILIIGIIIVGISALGLVFSKELWQIYLIQFVKGAGFALYLPSWLAIFSRHLDKNHTALDWAINSSAVSLGVGLAGIIGGTVATLFGFKLVFLSASVFAILSAIVLLLVSNSIMPRDKAKVALEKQLLRNQ
ncbi:MAG: MFS transporter [Patescibacteria group bacterium]